MTPTTRAAVLDVALAQYDAAFAAIIENRRREIETWEVRRRVMVDTYRSESHLDTDRPSVQEVARLNAMTSSVQQQRWETDELFRKASMDVERAVLDLDKPDEEDRRGDASERAAERIYNGWSEHAGFVPWVPGGNSHMQDKAREQARKEAVLRLKAMEPREHVEDSRRR